MRTVTFIKDFKDRRNTVIYPIGKKAKLKYQEANMCSILVKDHLNPAKSKEIIVPESYLDL